MLIVKSDGKDIESNGETDDEDMQGRWDLMTEVHR